MQDFYYLKRDNNPLREEAFTLSCLGKIHPASSSDLIRCGAMLSELLEEIISKDTLKNEILITGLTESGIIPALLMYLESTRKNLNTHLIYSTRRSLPGIAFNENHSHGPDHILPLKDCTFREIWIVEDEITSGNTVFNLIMQMNNHLNIDCVRVFAFADFRNMEQKSDFITRTAENNICCTVHALPLSREKGKTINNPQPLIHNDAVKNTAPTGRTIPENDFKGWLVPDKRPALGVKSNIFPNPLLWSLPPDLSSGTILSVGESVDITACFALTNKNISFQQISLSPWKVDNQSILSRMSFKGKYYLYNYEKLKSPVYIICDPIEREIETEVIEKLKTRNIHVKPFTAFKDIAIQLNMKNNKNKCFKKANGLPWNQHFYLNLEEEVHPFRDTDKFRPLDRAYNGNNTFWSTPSPEPDLSDAFWDEVALSFTNDSLLKEAAKSLAASILEKYPDPGKILFVSILRAGVPITDWLCRLLPGSMGAAISLFVGLGIDQAALKKLARDFPGRSIIFVDGWTGRGGVARAIAELDAGPLAVLIDPWGWADFSGIQEDIFCPSACFTGLATLGFSRTFFVDKNNFFSAYRFSEIFSQKELVKNWQTICPKNPGLPKKPIIKRFHAQTQLRIHSNEVCRALINAAPEILYFKDNKPFAEKNFDLLLKLAEQRSIPAQFNAAHLKTLKTNVACSIKTSR